MRHRYKKIKYLNTGVVKKQLVLRNLLTSLIKNWELITTPKRAKVLKSFADKFFNRVMRLIKKYSNNEEMLKKEVIKLVNVYFTNDGGPYRFGGKRKAAGQLNVKEKFVDLMVPALKELDITTGFIQDYKLWFRKGDWVEEILVKLRPEILKNVNVEIQK